MSRLHNFGITFPYLIGPMVGISHVAFRKLILSYTPVDLNPIIFTEMLSTKRIPVENFATSEALQFDPCEPHLVMQLLGNNENLICKSIDKLLPYNPFGFDINMGCPARQILKHSVGVELMNDVSAATNLVSATKKHSPLPISVKIRGNSEDDISTNKLNDFINAMHNAGADWVTLHARSQSQKHKGNANWNLASQLSSINNIPLVINGGIQTANDAIAIVNQYKADGAMLARAAVARPWILWQIAEDLGITTKPLNSNTVNAPRGAAQEGEEFTRAVLRLLDILCEHFINERFIVERIAFYCAIASPWFQFGHAFWKMTTKAKNVAELRNSLNHFNENHKNPMVEKITFWH